MKDIVRELTTLLEAERAHLLTGEFEKLMSVSEQKLQIRERLQDETQNLDDAELTNLKDLCATNDRLLRASLDGFSAAKSRLEAIRNARFRLTTYSGDGKLTRSSSGPNSVERRA